MVYVVTSSGGGEGEGGEKEILKIAHTHITHTHLPQTPKRVSHTHSGHGCSRSQLVARVPPSRRGGKWEGREVGGEKVDGWEARQSLPLHC